MLTYSLKLVQIAEKRRMNAAEERVRKSRRTHLSRRPLTGAMTDLVSKAEAPAFICACSFNVPCDRALSTTYRESHPLKRTAKTVSF